MRFSRGIDTAWQDARYGFRQLRQNPLFATVAVLSLGLGIGANTAIFQLVDAVRLRTLPLESPEQLATVDFPTGSMRSGWFSTRSARLTYALWQEIQAQQKAFSGIFAWSAARFNLAQGGEARYAEGLYVTPGYFKVLGVQPILGRVHVDADDQPGCSMPGAVISYAFWQREFGGETGVIGREVSLDGHRFPVIGVTPPSFFGVEVGYRAEVAVPLCADRILASDAEGRAPKKHAWWLSAMGRLKPGWTTQRATAHLEALAPGIMQATLPPNYRPDTAKRFLANKLVAAPAATGVSRLRREYENPLWILLAITALVLLIACANLANLLLARASVREREIAIRQSVGASRGRLVAQLLIESLIIAGAGAALGVLLAQSLSRGLVAFLTTSNNPIFVGVGVDLRVLGFTAALAVGTCVLFGLLPAFQATRVAPASAMRASGRGMTAGRERFSLRRALVVTQIATCMVLLVGSLLFVRSLQKLLAVETGFRPEGVLITALDFRRANYPVERRRAIRRNLLQRMNAIQGVTTAAQVLLPPIGGGGWDQRVHSDKPNAPASGININMVSEGYFRTMGTAVIAGRDFDRRDAVGSPKVAIVNEALVKQVFKGENPLGHTFAIEGDRGKPDVPYQVIGIVRNTKYYQLREEFTPIAFLPTEQDEEPETGATFVLRTAAPLSGVFEAVKASVAQVHPEIGIEFRVFSNQLKESLMRDRLMAVLAGSFGFLAALLATLGLYGVIAYMVARRRSEIGVRIALGADRGRIIRFVLSEAVLLVGTGTLAGTALALWAGRAAGTLLYGLKPYDPATIAGAIALLSTVALLASYGPARRASRLEPSRTLREE